MAKPRRKRSSAETRASDARPATPATPDEAALRVFPHELRPGDRISDEQGQEREVVDHPATYRQGKLVEVRIQKPGAPESIETRIWPAHEQIRVRRS